MKSFYFNNHHKRKLQLHLVKILLQIQYNQSTKLSIKIIYQYSCELFLQKEGFVVEVLL